MKKLLIIVWLIVAPWAASAQLDSLAPMVEELLLESYEERITEEDGAADFTDELEQLLQYQ